MALELPPPTQLPGHPTPRPLPAPQRPEGRRPVCIQSLFILCRSLKAVMDTSWFLSPNSSRWAKRGMYRQGSVVTHASVRALGRSSLTVGQQSRPQGHPPVIPLHRLPVVLLPETRSLPDPQLAALSARPGGAAAAGNVGLWAVRVLRVGGASRHTHNTLLLHLAFRG